MRRNQTFIGFMLCGLFVFAQVGFAVTITTTAGGGQIGSSLTGDDFGHITNFTVGSVQHVSNVSYFLTMNGGAPFIVGAANFNDVGDNPVTYFEPGNFQIYNGANEYSNVIRSSDNKLVIGFGVRLRDPSRSNPSIVSWEPTMQITNISGNPITLEAMRYTQGIGYVSFSNSDGIAGSGDDVAVYYNSAYYYDFFGLTTSRQLDRNGNLLNQIQNGGPGFALNNNVAFQAAPGESAFIAEPFTIPPGGRIITNYTKNVVAVGQVDIEPIGVSVNFTNVGNSADGNPGGLVIAGELTGPPLGGVNNVQAPLVRVSSIRRWSFFTTIDDSPGATANLIFAYNPATDGISNENTLELATRNLLTSQWVKWDNVIRNPAANTITAVGITQNELNSMWILASTGDNSLPVQLSTFTARASESGIILNWRTEAEVNNIGFSVYRSEEKDGNYTKIAFVSGANSSAIPNDYQFTDNKIEAGKTYFYFLEDVDIAGEKSKSRVIKVMVLPVQTTPTKEFCLLQNYPNPFNPETWIPYELAADELVTISIYDVRGRLIRQLNLGKQTAGSYLTKQQAAYWDGKDQAGQAVSSGVYFYSLKSGAFQATRRLVIQK